jgi:cardiolipin synthase C
MTADNGFAEELAEIAGELTTAQVLSWSEVLDDFAALSSAVESALVRCTPGAPGTLARRLVTAWQHHGPRLPGTALALALRAAGQVHAKAERQRPSLVVSGPFDFSAPTRFTRSAALEVVATASKSLLIVSFATHGMAELVDELHSAADRGVSIDCVFERSRKGGGTLTGQRSSGEVVFGSLRDRAEFWQWSGDQRKRERDTSRDSRAALHAKIISADARTALVSSANLTNRAYTRNLEIGVILRDPELVKQLDEHFHRLMDNGTLKRMKDGQ